MSGVSEAQSGESSDVIVLNRQRSMKTGTSSFFPPDLHVKVCASATRFDRWLCVLTAYRPQIDVHQEISVKGDEVSGSPRICFNQSDAGSTAMGL